MWSRSPVSGGLRGDLQDLKALVGDRGGKRSGMLLRSALEEEKDFSSPSHPPVFFTGDNKKAEIVLETGIWPAVTGSCWYVFLGSHGNRRCLRSSLKAGCPEDLRELLQQKTSFSRVSVPSFSMVCSRGSCRCTFLGLGANCRGLTGLQKGIRKI